MPSHAIGSSDPKTSNSHPAVTGPHPSHAGYRPMVAPGRRMDSGLGHGKWNPNDLGEATGEFGTSRLPHLLQYMGES